MKKFRSSILIEFVRFLTLGLGKIVWRVKFHNKQNIPVNNGSGLLIVSNHQSYLDPFLIGAPIKKRPLRFMAWDEAFDWIFIGSLIKKLGAFPVSLKRGGTVSALKQAVKILKNGETLVMFPEASREGSDGRLLQFKTGAVRLAIETGVPILPVTIKGANRVWSQHHKFPRLGKIEIFYHEILFLPKKEEKKIQDQVALGNIKLREIISSV